MNFSRDGMIYVVIHSSGKPPLLTGEEVKAYGLAFWDISLYSTEKGRKLGIANLRKLNVDLIYTLDLNLRDLMAVSKMADPATSDRRLKRLNKI